MVSLSQLLDHVGARAARDDAMRDLLASLERVLDDLGHPAAPPVVATTHVRLLGPFVVERDGGDMTPSGLAGRLLRIVATRGPVHVEEVAELLWAGAPAGQGRVRIRNVLTRLRDVCGDVVVRHGDCLRVAPDVVVDVDDFARRADQVRERLVEEPGAVAGVADLVATARHELLPDDAYAVWAEAPRAAHRRRCIQLLDALAAARLQTGDVPAAVALLEDAITLDPYDEARYLHAASLLLDEGRRCAAVALLHRAEDVLGDLGVHVSPAMVALFARARNTARYVTGTRAS